ncbi:hypothetical protein BDQ17DRAFT_1348346 [Cyathus striatus]|nr:hypothetical protein BDQ17DRAFT_1348346 [Cyathus striatus]
MCIHKICSIVLASSTFRRRLRIATSRRKELETDGFECYPALPFLCCEPCVME